MGKKLFVNIFGNSIINILFDFYSDLCAAYGANMITLLDAEPIHDLLTQGRRSKNSKTKTLSQWATKEIRKLKNANNSW